MIENENDFFFFKEDAFLEELHSIFSHLRLKSWKMYIYRGEIKKKKNKHKHIIKKKKISKFFLKFFFNFF